MRHEKRTGGSLDETLPRAEGEARGRFDWLLERKGAQRGDDEARGRAELDALAAALGSLGNEDMRRVISLTVEGHTSSEIGERLGLSVSNVDQLRSRGLRQIGRGMDGDE